MMLSLKYVNFHQNESSASASIMHHEQRVTLEALMIVNEQKRVGVLLNIILDNLMRLLPVFTQ